MTDGGWRWGWYTHTHVLRQTGAKWPEMAHISFFTSAHCCEREREREREQEEEERATITRTCRLSQYCLTVKYRRK